MSIVLVSFRMRDGLGARRFAYGAVDQVHRAETKVIAGIPAATDDLIQVNFGRRDTGVGGTSPWRLLFHDFEVVDEGLDVEIVCDFYGTTGEAWFDLNSFRLKRL